MDYTVRVIDRLLRFDTTNDDVVVTLLPFVQTPNAQYEIHKITTGDGHTVTIQVDPDSEDFLLPDESTSMVLDDAANAVVIKIPADGLSPAFINQGGGGGGGSGSPGPFQRTILLKNLTPKTDATDHVTVYGAKEGESSTAFRVALTSKKTITADCTVVVKLFYQDVTHTVGTFTIAADQPLNVPVIFKGTDLDYTTFADMSVLWGDITASDGSKDLDGVISLTVWWKGRSSGMTTAPGLGTTGGPWDPATIYDTGDVVEHEGNAYASTIDENVGIDPITGPVTRTGPAPLDAPLEWDLIAMGAKPHPSYMSALFAGPDVTRTITGETHGYPTPGLMVLAYDNATPRNPIQVGWTVDPTTFDVTVIFATAQTDYYVVINGFAGEKGLQGDPGIQGDPGFGALWGAIGGTLSSQTDLQTALTAKLDDSQLDTDGTLAANSDSKIASQKAVKTYVAANAGGVSNLPIGLPGSLPSSGNGQIFLNYSDTNQVPTMTSDTAPSGNCYASSSYATTPPWNAFAPATTNGWITNGTSTGWIGYKFPSAKIITSYTIRPWDADTFPSRCPNSWKVQGSNNTTNGSDGTWTDLDSRSFTGWVVGVYVRFRIPSPGSYTAYRLNILTNGGNAYTGVHALTFDNTTGSTTLGLYIRDSSGVVKEVQMAP